MKVLSDRGSGLELPSLLLSPAGTPEWATDPPFIWFYRDLLKQVMF